MTEKKIVKPQLRSFGLIVAAGFSVIALWPMVFRSEGPRMWALAIAISMAAAALVFPAVLKPVFRVWMAIGEVLGWLNTRIILTILYYGLIVPIGAALRYTGKDAMLRRFDPGAASYRIIRTKRPASHMQRQY